MRFFSWAMLNSNWMNAIVTGKWRVTTTTNKSLTQIVIVYIKTKGWHSRTHPLIQRRCSAHSINKSYWCTLHILNTHQLCTASRIHAGMMIWMLKTSHKTFKLPEGERGYRIFLTFSVLRCMRWGKIWKVQWWLVSKTKTKITLEKGPEIYWNGWFKVYN